MIKIRWILFLNWLDQVLNRMWKTPPSTDLSNTNVDVLGRAVRNEPTYREHERED